MRPAGGPQPGRVDDPPADGSCPSHAGSRRGGGDGSSVAHPSQQQTRGVHATQATQSEGLNVRQSEPRPTESASLAHPKPTTSGRLTHVDKEGRAAMVDVGKVRTFALTISSRL